jgi:hypothetical protein
MKNTINTLVALLLLCTAAWAQDETNDRSERVEALKIGFITEQLALTTKEASAFWPVYNEFTTQMKTIRQKQKENARSFSANANPTDADSEKFISAQLAHKQAEVNLTKKYAQEFRKVLPVSKVAKLLTLEHAFKQQLLQRLKETRRPGRR